MRAHFLPMRQKAADEPSAGFGGGRQGSPFSDMVTCRWAKCTRFAEKTEKKERIPGQSGAGSCRPLLSIAADCGLYPIQSNRSQYKKNPESESGIQNPNPNLKEERYSLFSIQSSRIQSSRALPELHSGQRREAGKRENSSFSERRAGKRWQSVPTVFLCLFLHRKKHRKNFKIGRNRAKPMVCWNREQAAQTRFFL